MSSLSSEQLLLERFMKLSIATAVATIALKVVAPMPSALPIAFGASVAARTAFPSRTTTRALLRS
ncbi:hypothetical protein ACGLFO_10520 [Corynebacterium hesseae]|uniref:hypothetical protein n=1 Tax=Corynebacterium hesseae TaxID=2913502 RepID=UPI00373EE1DE